MTDPDLRHIAIVLDRSGSMQSVKEDTEGGLRAFLAEQQEVEARTLVSLYQFDDHYEAVYENKPLADVPDFRLKPRGMTALLDAVGRTIARLGEDLAALPDARRPGEVVVVILTDGLENASSDYSRERVREMITHQQDKYGWVFLFLGADQDAFAAAGGIGIAAGQALSYSSRKTRGTFSAASSMLRRGRASGGDYSFSPQERDATSD
ncbi:vWA domain-containing protein [Yinghuangia soli]|uniref:VWA domain-containing protein n=1 Tax=Yinghuangia soli TaxID=2908204 RepID=A0AA41PXN4_9ACTN|nr:vWA domain-containing protein [Yinghuangia soli]MCF2527749.1 VWA domain-containing protein [Yinghuangia soli]